MRASLVLAVLLAGCAADGVEPPRQDEADTHRRLARARTEHTELLAELSSAPTNQLEACRSSSGDCLLQVAESRGRLVSAFRLDACESAPTPETKSRCVTEQLEHAGHPHDLADYFALESWCFRQLSQCTHAKAEEARKAALDARFVARKQDVERAPEAIAARGAVALSRARIEYLRATLPPNAQVCQANSDAPCHGVESSQRELDDGLRADDFDSARAVSRYVAAREAEASCQTSELDCLSDALASFGVFPEARKVVDRNLALLAERQKLLAQVSEEAGQHCLSSSQKQHQAGIVSAYVAYAHEQVLYFRMQLDKSFAELHEDELSCLRAGRKTAPAVQAVAARR